MPFCGDYFEANAWSPDEARRYQHFLDKRRRMEELETASPSAKCSVRATPGSVVLQN